MARTIKHTAWNEVFALLLLGAGTLLFLALISYTPRDVPSWVWFSQVSSPNRPAQNFIGPFGAIIAGFSYMMIGAASYLLAVVLLGFGGAKLFNAKLRVTPRLVWIALFLASGACLLQLQTQHLQGWRAAFNIQGPGGWIGYALGKKLLLTWMGGVGSIILLTGVYVSSLILMTGLRPIHIVRQAVAGVRSGMIALQEWQLKRRLRKSDLKGQLEISQRELAKQQRVIEKQLKKQGAPVPEPAGVFVSPEELANRPKPKVVDTTALPDEPPRKKPSLAELRGTEKKAKAPAGLTSQTWDAEHYTLPGFDLLDAHDTEGRTAADPAELEQIQQILIETLGQFGIAVAAGDITKGPTITRYEVYPAKGVRVDRIVSPRARPGAGHERGANQYSRADSGQGHRRHRAGQHAKSEGDAARAAPIAGLGGRENKIQAPARPRQGRLRKNDHRRSRADAAFARRRHDRQRQERLHQRAGRQHDLPVHAGGAAFHHDRSQGGRDAGLQFAAASGYPGRDRSEKGAPGLALGD